MLVTNQPVVLLPFCSQHEKYQSAPGSRVGTPAYLAPEVILTTKGKTYDGKVRMGMRSDTHSLHLSLIYLGCMDRHTPTVTRAEQGIHA